MRLHVYSHPNRFKCYEDVQDFNLDPSGKFLIILFNDKTVLGLSTQNIITFGSENTE